MGMIIGQFVRRRKAGDKGDKGGLLCGDYSIVTNLYEILMASCGYVKTSLTMHMATLQRVKKFLNIPNIWLIIQVIHRAVKSSLTFRARL